MSDIKIDFLIVGAAKAGTTALYRMLEEHPQIYLPKNKEPKFISSQFLQYPLAGPGDEAVEMACCKTIEELKALYSDKSEEMIAGEGSIDNLFYYEQSIPLIQRYFGDPKIIIMLRNPIERAYSAYYHLIRDGRETLDFSEALDQEESRRNDNWQFLWFYFSVGLYYQQVKAYMDSFSSVKIVIYDDFVADPETTLKDVFTFLGVDRNYVAAIRVMHNISGVPKNRIYGRLLNPSSPIFKKFKRQIRSVIGRRNTNKLRGAIKSRLLHKPTMEHRVRKMLHDSYAKDLRELSELLGIDLSCWN